MSWLCHGCVILAAADMEGLYYHVHTGSNSFPTVHMHMYTTIYIILYITVPQGSVIALLLWNCGINIMQLQVMVDLSVHLKTWHAIC